MKKPISWIKPDVNQPRTHFEQESLKGMAESFKTTGVINPVQVDKDGVIITGERRYRAMLLAGFTEVEEGKEFRIIEKDLTPYERLEVQMVENIHQSSIAGDSENMDPVDVATGYRDMLDEYHRAGAGSKNSGISHLSMRMGVTEHSIRRSLRLLEESAPIKKALRRGIITKSDVEEMRVVKDATIKEALMEKLIKGEISGHKTIRALVKNINQQPENAIEIVEHHSGEEDQGMNKVINEVNRISSVLRKYPLGRMTGPMKSLAAASIQDLKTRCESWLMG